MDYNIPCILEDGKAATVCVEITGLAALGIPDGAHRPLCDLHGNMSKQLAAEAASSRQIAERNGYHVASVTYDFHNPHRE